MHEPCVALPCVALRCTGLYSTLPHINNKASRNGVNVIVSPMMRTLETIRPTLEHITGARIHVQACTTNRKYAIRTTNTT